jgi:hypothetical protein
LILNNEKPFHPTTADDTATFGRPSVLQGKGFPSLNPEGKYSPEWAYVLSVIAGWAYAEGQFLADELFFHGLPECDVYQINVENKALLVEATAYVIVDTKNKVAVLAFRGTVPDSLINWLTDADSAKYRFGDGFVHSGFYANVEAVWADIVKLLDKPLRDGAIEDLYITGHSLGAAMTILAGARIFKDQRADNFHWWGRVRGVYAFAPPMVGDAAFARQFEVKFGSKLLHRFTYDEDVVPCLPPLSVDPGFEHFGQRRSAKARDAQWEVGGKDRHAHLLELGFVGENFFTRRINALKAVGDILFPYSLDDHSPRGYIDVSRNSVPQEHPQPQDTRPVGWVDDPPKGTIGREPVLETFVGTLRVGIAQTFAPLLRMLPLGGGSGADRRLGPPST